MALAFCEAKQELLPLQTCYMRAVRSEQGKNYPLPAFLFLLGPSQPPPPPPLGLLWPALFLCLGQAGKKAFGSAPCLSRVQHYQGSCLVSSISRCLSLLCSQVSSQDFLALGKIECLSEPSRPVFHLQPLGSNWVTVPNLPFSPSPPAWPAEEALCVLVVLQRKGGS